MIKKLIYQPLKPFRINQRFGENDACVSLDGKNKVITCNGYNPPAGYKSLYGTLGHRAVDLAAYHGQELYAAQDGVVYMIDTNPRTGLDVRIESFVDGVRFRHIYEHLMGYQVKIGSTVKAGDLIGWTDNTGYSAGDHLHFQMEILVGKEWVKVDPLLYMEPLFALDYKGYVSKIAYLKEYVARLMDSMAYKLRTK